MAHDGGIAEQVRHVARAHAGDAIDIEACECLAKSLALAQDGDPGEARLKAFETQFLEEARVVGDRESPLAVVVVDQ